MCYELLKKYLQRDEAERISNLIKKHIKRKDTFSAKKLILDLNLGSRNTQKLLFCIDTFEKNC